MSATIMTAIFTFGAMLLSADARGDSVAQEGAEPLTIDACELLSSSEIRRIVGRSVSAGARRDSGLESNGSYSSACVWIIEQSTDTFIEPATPLGGRSFAILHAMQWPHGSGQAQTYLEAFREAAVRGELPADPVAREFGDEALWWGDGLAVRKGDVSFGISVFIPTREKAAQPGVIEEQLASFILDRLSVRGCGRAPAPTR
jgi:hypothetical protein